MVLVDTSVWVGHLRRVDPVLAGMLEAGQVLVHPFVIGELACGSIGRRGEVLGLLGRIDEAPKVSDQEAMHLLESRRLMGAGLGWVDVHLLASALVAGAGLWTRDEALGAAARRLGVGTAPEPE
jgi:predicted nucleic acid-binding protein